MPAVIVLAMDDRVGGSVGDTDYGLICTSYSRYRRPDPRLAAAVAAALGGARTVLNIGAGAGSYEPKDRTVTAVEPSAAMRAQRPASMPAVDATAEALPFPDGSFDAAMSNGFNEAYYGRPERLLDPQARLSCSAWSFVESHVHERFVTDLARDLETDAWDDRHRALRHQPTFDGSLVLTISEP